jgi:tRNA(Ile)-lysidine synthetase-like protein
MNITKSWLEHPQWWFHSTPETDREVIHFYGDFEKLYPRNDIDSIILYDQLSRHYFRNDIFNIMRYTAKAIEYVQPLLIGDLGRFSPEEFVFILLPLRHTKRATEIESAIKYLKQHPKYHESPSIFVRFYKASIEQLSKFHGYFLDTYIPCESNFLDRTFSEYDILDYIPDTPLILGQDALEEDINYLTRHNVSKVIVSLSGGVDSNVLLHRYVAAARKLSISCEAVHINYSNRGMVNEKEVIFLRHLCNKLDVKLYVRNIREIRRTKDHLRDFYEEVTRKIRFGIYKLLSDNPQAIILLGHHQDDAVENILSNMRKGRNWDNLMGMSEEYYEREVRMGRPFLNDQKINLVDYAVKNGIPYLCDSTPKWSERGRMRDTVIPALEILEGQCNGLVNASNEMSRLYHILENSLWKPFLKQIIYNGVVTIPYRLDSFDWGMCFWSGLWIEIARYLHVAYPSKRSIENFLKAIKKVQFKNRIVAQIYMSKNLRVVIPNNMQNIIVSISP